MGDYEGHVRPWKLPPKSKPYITPKEGQESVWEYPRPPAIQRIDEIVSLQFSKIVIKSKSAIKIMETASPPTYYIPVTDIDMNYFVVNKQSSYCEWKGMANYVDMVVDDTVYPSVGWMYNNPKTKYIELMDHIAFYASKFDQCQVGDMKVTAQAGDFYGGWITDNIVGPFKGDPGTRGW